MRVYGWLIFSVFLQVVFQRCHLVKHDRNGGVAQKGDQKAGLSRKDLREDRERREHSSSGKRDSRRRSRSSSRDRHRSAVSPIHDTRRSSGASFHISAQNQARSSRAKSQSECFPISPPCPSLTPLFASPVGANLDTSPRCGARHNHHAEPSEYHPHIRLPCGGHS